MNDYWDFDPDPTHTKRPELAEKLVRLANKYLKGKPFHITSEKIPVSQNNNQPTTDYSDNPQVIPNRVAKAHADVKKTTSD
ncbi:MAG TPA: hypothetical protein VMT76_01790 [Puia sp.]|nr:hypothetical protein [Puia sp.]